MSDGGAAARGSDATYCSAYPGEPHHMVAKSAGQKVRFVEQCSLCDWINGAALDGYADNAIKEALTQRAARIALSIETEPFAFVQQEGEELTLREVLYQALGAASMCWVPRPHEQVFDSTRAAQIGRQMEAEVERFTRLGEQDAARKVEEQLEPDIKAWMHLAYELYALSCNSSPQDGSTDKMRSDWQEAFVRLRDRFHQLLPILQERLKAEATG